MSIGHPEAMREETPDGLRYIDPQNLKMQKVLQSYGIELEQLDSFIEMREAEGHALAGQLRMRRQFALWAFNNLRKFQELGLEAWRSYIEIILAQKHLHEIGEEIIPLAWDAKKTHEGRVNGGRKGGSKKKPTRAKLPTDEKLRQEFNELLPQYDNEQIRVKRELLRKYPVSRQALNKKLKETET